MYVELTHKIQNCDVSEVSQVGAPWASAWDCLAVGAWPGWAARSLPSTPPRARFPRRWWRWAPGAPLDRVFLCSLLQGSKELLRPSGSSVTGPQDPHNPAPCTRLRPLVFAQGRRQGGSPGHQHSGPVPFCSGHCALSVVPGTASPAAGFSPVGPPALCPGVFSRSEMGP